MKRGFPKKWAILFYVVLFAATAGALLWISMGREQVTPLTADERQDLVEVDEPDGKRLRHPQLGFTLAHPGAKFFRSAEAEDKIGFGHDPSTRFHVYTELDSGRMLIVALSARPGMDGDGFATAVDTISDMFVHKTAAGFGKEAAVKMVEDTVDRERRTARMHARIAEQASVRLDARLDRFAGGKDYLLVVIAVSPTDDSLAPIVASVRR